MRLKSLIRVDRSTSARHDAISIFIPKSTIVPGIRRMIENATPALGGED